jgi:lipopolysaccharide/colanic/teichoic acid biosynthesis glycosyltransferase
MKDGMLTKPQLIYRFRPRSASSRRLLDFCVALGALALATPILLAAALAIKLEDGGPVLFQQKRVGRFGRLFTIYKLRTMKIKVCGDAPSPKHSNDDRITGVGRILRKTSIDELPQLLNVLNGTMALVGPRPEMPFIVRQKYLDWQHLRHLAMPGVTGLWQATCRSKIALDKPEATLIDLQYIENASPLTDGKIMLRTVHSLFSARGAY